MSKKTRNRKARRSGRKIHRNPFAVANPKRRRRSSRRRSFRRNPIAGIQSALLGGQRPQDLLITGAGALGGTLASGYLLNKLVEATTTPGVAATATAAAKPAQVSLPLYTKADGTVNPWASIGYRFLIGAALGYATRKFANRRLGDGILLGSVISAGAGALKQAVEPATWAKLTGSASNPAFGRMAGVRGYAGNGVARFAGRPMVQQVSAFACAPGDGACARAVFN